MRIVIATTGSGGHLFCGLSIAKAIKERNPDIKICFLGTEIPLTLSLSDPRPAWVPRGRGMGEGVCRFYKIYATGFILSQIIGILQSGLLYLYLRPHVVVSTGGFASFGIVLWSWFFNKPCIIHEQNLVPGKVNRLSAYFADKILVSFEETKDYFIGKRCIFTGMPIRFKKKIPQQEARERLGLDRDRFTILVMGGSKGAHSINEFVADMLEKLPRDMQFIHLTGSGDLGFVREAYKKYNLCAYVEGFSTRMDEIYSASNLVIGRAGSSMLAEITFFGLPGILIPYPYSPDRHQYKNAGFMARHGAASVMPEEDRIIELIESRDKLAEMARCSASLAKPDAVERIVDEILEVVNA